MSSPIFLSHSSNVRSRQHSLSIDEGAHMVCEARDVTLRAPIIRVKSFP